MSDAEARYKQMLPIFKEVAKKYNTTVDNVFHIWNRQFEILKQATRASTQLIELTNVGLFNFLDYTPKLRGVYENHSKKFIERYGEEEYRQFHPEIEDNQSVESGIQKVLDRPYTKNDGRTMA